MWKYHTKKLYIPDRQNFDRCVELYRERYGKIPAEINTIKNIVQWVTGFEIDGSLLELDGRAFAMPGGGSFMLLINSKTPPWQRRADIAHELGHILHTFVVQRERIINITENRSEDECEHEERICDEIGAGLLCPEWALDNLVTRAFQELGDIDGQRLVARLSRQFQFPQDEMEAHLRRHHNGQILDRIVYDAKHKVR